MIRSTFTPSEANQATARRRKAAAVGPPLVGQDLGVGQACGVVDANVDELPAGQPHPLATASDLHLAALAGHPMAGGEDPAQLLDVEVDELPRSPLLVAVRRLGGIETGEAAEPDPSEPAG